MKILISIFAFCILLYTGFSDLAARTWYINPDGTGDAPTIQAGIDSAIAGDIVELADGTYNGDGNRDIDYYGKSIIVRSGSNDPDGCIIDCEGTSSDPHRGFFFQSEEGAGSMLEGVTITNGYLDTGGVIICANYSSPIITNCKILDNRGIGVFCVLNSSPIITNCKILNNRGIGVYCWGGCSPRLTDCCFSVNSHSGLYCDNLSNPNLTGCIFSEHSDYAIRFDYDSSVTLTNCLLVENSNGVSFFEGRLTLENTIIAFNDGYAIYAPGNPYVFFTSNCSDIYGNPGGDWVGCAEGHEGINGNFSADPQFCGILGSNNYYLQSDSPCAPGNHPDGYDCGLIGAYPVDCETISTERASWGKIKAMYR